MTSQIDPSGAIAERLGLGIDTVKTHVRRIFRKLSVASRAQALAAVRDAGVAIGGAPTVAK